MKLTQEKIEETLDQLKVVDIQLGAWGIIAAKYMEDQAPISTARMKMQGSFLPLMKKREKQALEFMADTAEELLKKNPVLKEWSYLEQVQHREQIEHQARELAIAEILCPPISEQDEKIIL